MTTLDELLELIRSELGLPVTAEEAHEGFDRIAGWDSVHLLWLATELKRQTGRNISLPDLLEAPSLEAVFKLSTGA